MGELIGRIIGGVIDRMGRTIDRRNIVKSLRETANDIERGDIVPDSLIDRARALAAVVAGARGEYKDG